jgi:hypothetical protein
MSVATQEKVLKLVEAMLALVALMSIAVLGAKPIISSACRGEWRFLGMSPLILLFGLAIAVLVALTFWVVSEKAVALAAALFPPHRRVGLLRQAVVLVVLLTPMSMTYTVIASVFQIDFATADQPIALCAVAMSSTTV